MRDSLFFDQLLAFTSGALTPLLPLLRTHDDPFIIMAAALLGGVTGLRLFRNTAFGDRQAQDRAERGLILVSAAPQPSSPAIRPTMNSMGVEGPV